MKIDSTPYTPFEILQIKGSFTYFIGLIITMIVAVSFLILSQISVSDIIKPTLIYCIAVILAFVIFRNKKQRKSATLLTWIVGFLTLLVPIVAKYNYGYNIGWTFAVQSYNSTALLIIMVVLLYLQYDKKVFLFYSCFAIANWAFFFYWALRNGAEVHVLATTSDGTGIVTGVVFAREVFFIFTAVFIFLIVYRVIPVINEFNSRVMEQMALIESKVESERQLNREIKERMESLFTQVEEQNKIIAALNERMQTQSATFEEMSAAMEELLVSAENISSSATDQVDGNLTMENIISEFMNIKNESTRNLKETYTEIEGIVAQTSISTESLVVVENTIASIKEQSKRIGDTVSIIVDIADKINLLSLNASIEAARAGEYGRGFAVVADEIGKLAVQTSESIKEIEKVLSYSSRITDEGVRVITSTAEMIKQLIAKMGASSGKIKLLQESILVEERYIKVIIEQMKKNIDLARTIGTATSEQKKAIEDTTIAIEQVNQIVGEMAMEVNRLARTSDTILQNAIELLHHTEHTNAVKQGA